MYFPLLLFIYVILIHILFLIYLPLFMEELYQKLRRIEEQLDKTTLKRYLEFEEQHNTRLKCLKRLRIFLKTQIIDSSIHIRIDGRVINDYKNIVETRMSELLKRVCIIFNEEAYEDSNVILLDEDILKNSTNNDKQIKNNAICKEINGKENIFEWVNNEEKIDAFEINEKVLPNSIKILFEFDNSKDLVRLSKPLSALLKTTIITKTKAIIELWKYMRFSKLVNVEGEVTCDDALRSVFKCEKLNLDNITQLIYQHFLPLEIFSFNIPVSNYERIFDVNIERDDLTDFPAIFKDRHINILEKKIQNTIDSIEIVNDKIDVLDKFSKNPVKFVNKFLMVENNDLDFLCSRNGEGLFNDPKISEMIYNMIKDLK